MCPDRHLCTGRWLKRFLGLSAKSRFYAAQSEGVTTPLKAYTLYVHGDTHV